MGNAFMEPFQEFKEQGARPPVCANCGEALLPSEDAVLTCPACGQGHRSLAPPPPSAEMGFLPGDRVAVLWGGRWWAAHVVEVPSERERRVHYEGWGPSFDEDVDRTRIRAINYEPGPSIVPPAIDESQLKIKRANWVSAAGVVLVFVAGVGFALFLAFGEQVYNPSSGTAGASAGGIGAVFDHVPGRAVGPTDTVKKGGAYFVKWGDGWYPATVLEIVSPDEFVVQYDGWSIDSNEIVSRDRLRTRDE